MQSIQSIALWYTNYFNKFESSAHLPSIDPYSQNWDFQTLKTGILKLPKLGICLTRQYIHIDIETPFQYALRHLLEFLLICAQSRAEPFG